MGKLKGVYLKYEDDDPAIREMINVFRNRSRFYSEADEEYNNNINEAMRDAELNTVDDCLEFFRTWFYVYKQCKDEWE